ncbi:MAG: M28 family peptidase, partial [Gemmatimonadaceae bacterium]
MLPTSMPSRPAIVALAALLLGAAGVAARPIQRVRTTAPISARDLEERLTRLAHDSLMGRMTGSEGAFKATQYIAGEFKRLGLEPAGDSGGWFQVVPFWNAAIDPKSVLHVGNESLEVGKDFLPVSVYAPGRTLENTGVVYGGIATDSSHWISSDSAAGRIVVISAPPGPLPRQLPYQSGRWSRAVAIALVVLDRVGAESASRFRDGRPVSDTTRNAQIIPTLWITEHAASVLLGASVTSVQPGAVGLPTSGYFDYARSGLDFPARNVVAILRGGDPKLRGEFLSLTAHSDHVGFDHAPVDHDSIRAYLRVIRPMGADSPPHEPSAEEQARIRGIIDSLRVVHRPRQDSIRNGADDDGSGTVSLLEIAEAMSAAKVRPKRSILFVSHTAEEVGLLGSRWYADHPTVPRDSIIGEIDQDMVGRGAVGDLPESGPT